MVPLPRILSRFIQVRDKNRIEISPPSVKGQVNGLNTIREHEFQNGLQVFSRRPDSSPMGVRPMQWGDTVCGQKRGPETLMAYQGWKEKVYSGEKLSREQRDRIENKCGGHGLTLEKAEWLSREAAEVFEAVLDLLPAALLRSGWNYLKGFSLFSSRVGAARISAYERGEVCLYKYVLDLYWHLPGVMVHEIGHSTATRLLGKKESEWEVPPDSVIPEELRRNFLNALGVLAPTVKRFVVDYVYGRESRLNYILSSYEELIADLHVMYIYNGAAIRNYNKRNDFSKEAMAWLIAYNFLKYHVFAGQEYTYL